MGQFGKLSLVLLLISWGPLFSDSAYTGRRQSSYSHSHPTSNYENIGNSSTDKDKERGYKIIIRLDDAFGKAADDLSNLKELQEDMKVVRALVEDMAQDIREMRGQVPPDTENLIQGASADRLSGSRGFSASRPSWEVSLPKINCAELRLSGIRKSGVYNIQPDRSQPAFEVYCDMTTDGGGWTVIQRRGILNVPKSIRENFYRSWKEYESGFGSIRSDYWLGLEKIHALTEKCNNEMIVNITDWNNASKYARYGNFNISGKEDSYKLGVANYSGNAGDGLLQHNKMKFSTYDRQNDYNGDESCAVLYHGAWWYKDCFWSNLNGEYADDGSNGLMSSRRGIEWGTRHNYSYMKSEMKLRPKC